MFLMYVIFYYFTFYKVKTLFVHALYFCTYHQAAFKGEIETFLMMNLSFLREVVKCLSIKFETSWVI